MSFQEIIVGCLMSITRVLNFTDGYHNKQRQYIKKQRYHFAHKGLYSQSYGFSSSHVWMRELNYKEGWRLKNWCFQIVVLEQTLGSPLDYKEIKPVNPKENKSWIFIGRNNGEVESPSLTTWCTERIHWKRPWCWETLRPEEKGATEDEMIGWHHQLNRHELEKTPRDSEGHGSLMCCIWKN